MDPSLLPASGVCHVNHCLLCSHTEADGRRIQEHLLVTHHVVIADCHMVADLPRYLSYWKERIHRFTVQRASVSQYGDQQADIFDASTHKIPQAHHPITEFTTTIHSHSQPPRNGRSFHSVAKDLSAQAVAAASSSPTAPSALSVPTVPTTASTSAPLSSSPSASASATSKTAPASEPVPYYVLGGGLLLEDEEVRSVLQTQRLEEVLAKQQWERTDTTFNRTCLFCPERHRGETGRRSLFHHMFQTHGFNIGLPDNLVDIAQLLDLLQGKLDALQCLYCEKTFKSHAVLKLHMRKKKHFKISPRNHLYDRFYTINYLESGKNWEAIQREEDDEQVNQYASGTQSEGLTSGTETNDTDTERGGRGNGNGNGNGNEQSDGEWSDWGDEEDGAAAGPAACLFCTQTFGGPHMAFVHAKQAHAFDFRAMRAKGLDFYSCIKLINFIRRQRQQRQCVQCPERFASEGEWAAHLEQNPAHSTPARDAPFWRDAQYLLPTVEDDPLLCGFEDFDEDDDGFSDPNEEEGDEYHRDLKAEITQKRDHLVAELVRKGMTLEDVLQSAHEPLSVSPSTRGFHRPPQHNPPLSRSPAKR